MFGSDSALWPAWYFDAVSVVEACRVLDHNARVEAESADTGR